ncbi:MAG: TonB C-terminal domain-containing protein, partial [Burkholderiaceae bacterium]
IGIRWQSQTPVTLEAEVWSPQTQESATAPVEPTRPEPPAPVEVPKPVVTEPTIEKPDIALEQKKKRIAEEKERQEKLAQKEEEQRIENEKAAALVKKNKALEKAKVDKQRLQDEADAKQRAKVRDEEMRRISGATGGTGDAEKTQGTQADPSYVQILIAKIKRNTDNSFFVPSDLRDKLSVEYTVELFPNGDVKRIKKEHASVSSEYDEAVKSAIEASSPFPRDKYGNVPPYFTFTAKP